jgi:Family of unknown function (DUF6282)
MLSAFRRSMPGPWAAALLLSVSWQPLAGAGEAAVSAETSRALSGAIDIHVHNLPDDRPRSIDAIDVAKLAKARGMRGLVLKNHYEPTASMAYVVRKEVPGIEVFGGIDLNLTVGGINPAAVEHMTKVTGGYGKFVWMPTFDAENTVRFEKGNRPFVSVARNGELLPAVKEVIALIAKHGLVLATGHSSPAEGLLLVREGKRQNVRAMVVTHAMNEPVLMNVQQMKEAAGLGAYIEFVGGAQAGADNQAKVDRFAAAIRAIGVEHCILSSDLGQAENPVPPDGFGQFLVALRARGFSDAQIALMAKQNPAKVLGLP